MIKNDLSTLNIQKQSIEYQALQRLDPSIDVNNRFIKKTLNLIKKTFNSIFKNHFEVLQKKENNLIKKFDQINTDYHTLCTSDKIPNHFKTQLKTEIIAKKMKIVEKIQLLEYEMVKIRPAKPKASA